MKITEAAKTCGLSVHTIRYYEKSGMLPEISRGADGHRYFTPQLIEWLTLLYWLRETGMPLSAMSQFTKLAKADDANTEERRKILQDHASTLRERKAKLEKCEAILKEKIAIYDQK